MYERFESLCKERGVTAYKVAKATGISTATFSNWKAKRSTPKADKLQLIADYFDVPLETFTQKPKRRKLSQHFHPVDSKDERKPVSFQKSDLLSSTPKDVLLRMVEELPDGYPVYYPDKETAELAQAIFDNPSLMVLFDAAKDLTPEDISIAVDMLKRFKETNPDG